MFYHFKHLSGLPTLKFTMLPFVVISLFEKQVDELLKQRDSVHSAFTVVRTLSHSGSGNNLSNGSTSKAFVEDAKGESPIEDGGSDGKDKSSRKRWFNLNLKGSDKKLG